MKPFTALIKMQLNVNYGVSALKYRFTREKKKLWEPVLIAVVIPVSLLPLLAMYVMLMTGVFMAGSALEQPQPEVVLTISFLLAQVVILFFGMFYIMGTFYFSRDIESLIPLPLKPYEVVSAKFLVVMINEYLTGIPILLPPIIIFGAGTGQGLLYWIKSIVLILAAPALPLTVAALFIMVLMRFVNFRRYKDLLAIIGGLAAFVLAIGISVFAQNLPKNGDPDLLKNLLASQSGLIDLIGSRFPPSVWATRGLADSGLAGWGYFLLFIAVCAVLLALLFWLSNRFFYQSLLAGQEVTRKRKDFTEHRESKRYGRVSSPVQAMMKREWKLLFRTPIYALNGLTGSIMGPLIVLLMFFAQKGNQGTTQLFDIISKPEATPYVLLGGLGLMLFTAGMNLVASTSLSREGKTIWITKLIPVSAKQQVMAKLILSYLISAVGVIVTGLILWLFIKQPLIWVLGVILVGMLGAIPMVALSLLLDVFHPKLVWNSEQEAMKQNMNGLLGMLLSFLVLMILGLVALFLLTMKSAMWLVFLTLGAVSGVLGVLSILALFAVAERKYAELEA